MRAAAVIPARYASSRFPGKPLAEIRGRSMIEHVYRRTQLAETVSQVLVATDDERIFAAVRAFGGEVVMTRADHPSGTDRIAEAVREIEAEVIVNVQGDEPLLDPAEIDAVVRPFRTQPDLQMSTAAVPIRNSQDVTSPTVVKVVRDSQGFALYFSRLPIPYHRDTQPPPGAHLRHLGLYAYRKPFLATYTSLSPSPLERAECLEQLRVLEAGYRILVVLVENEAVGVDTPEDLERIRLLMEKADR